jgi:hypothetical protein
VKIDRKREPTRPVSDAQGAVIKYPATAKSLELTGLKGDIVRQRRRLAV